MKKNQSIIFIGIVLILSIVFFGIYFKSQTKGDMVCITVGGEEFKQVPLKKDQTIKVEFDNGDYNVIEIKDESVDITESNCDNQICVYDYPISKDVPGVIVCLPHQLVVEIKEG